MQLAEHHRLTLRSCTKSLHVLLLVSALAGALGLTRVCVLASDSEEKSPPELVRNVVQKLSQRQITRIEISYLDWGASVYGGVSKDYLLANYHYKVVVANPRWNTEGLQQALNDFKFQKVNSGALEFRIVCIFYAGTEEVLKLFFAGNAPVVVIDQVSFRAEPSLLSAVVAFLPHEAYERLYGSVLYQWVYSQHPSLRPEGKKDDDGQSSQE